MTFRRVIAPIYPILPTHDGTMQPARRPGNGAPGTDPASKRCGVSRSSAQSR